MKRWLSRAAVCFFALLILFLVGFLILMLLGHRYRDLANFLAFGILTCFGIALALCLAADRAHGWRGFAWRAVLLVLLFAVLWVFVSAAVALNYGGEVDNRDGWYAPADKIVFNDGFLMRLDIKVYEPGTVFWTGAFLPEYGFTD